MQPILERLKRTFSPGSDLNTSRDVTDETSHVSFDLDHLPLTPGATLLPKGVRFVVHSKHAAAVELCLFDPKNPARETSRVRLRRGERDLWYATVLTAKAGVLYGYRAHGPWQPQDAMRFNSRKLLLDPYALAIQGEAKGALHMHTTPDPQHPPGNTDNGAEMLKSVVIDTYFDWGNDAPPSVPWRDTMICELHVKGFTQQNPDVPAKMRGTYAGLAHPSVTKYLRDLGVTSVQLLPVHQHIEDLFLLEKGLTNYWGYNTVGFFAPHAEYAAATTPQEQVREFKAMVKALHAAGIEVILDVVYNHTAEGNEQGPTLMFRGLDDRSYYRHHFNEAGASYVNVTGCGNSVSSASPVSLRLIMDSLRYWVTEMHVDGFRFDLAVTVARNESDAFHAQSQFLSAIGQDPVLAGVKLIAEAWDIMSMDSYQVGQFPEPWRELNGKYRDTMRSWWRGDTGTTAEFAKRLCGSQDIYGWNNRPPLASVNMLTSHDGFTLNDLVTYNHKHNEANGEDNRDGDNTNHSTNCGVEGPTNDPAINETRARLRRGMMATLMCSLGVPFITAGDERGRTQKGNNNAYCQDNEISWVDWANCDKDLLELTGRMAAFRKNHAVFRRKSYFDGRINPTTELRDVTWLDDDGTLLSHDEWHSDSRRCFGALLDSEPAPLLLLFNNGGESLPFTLPGTEDTRWTLVFDTALTPSFPAGKHRTYCGKDPHLLLEHSVTCLELTKGMCGEIPAKIVVAEALETPAEEPVEEAPAATAEV